MYSFYSLLEDVTRLLPLYFITRAVILDQEEMFLLEIRKKKRFYRLKERFGFVTALATQMKLCGMTLDPSQQANYEEESMESLSPSSQHHFLFSVERLRGPDQLLASHIT